MVVDTCVLGLVSSNTYSYKSANRTFVDNEEKLKARTERSIECAWGSWRGKKRWGKGKGGDVVGWDGIEGDRTASGGGIGNGEVGNRGWVVTMIEGCNSESEGRANFDKQQAQQERKQR